MSVSAAQVMRVSNEPRPAEPGGVLIVPGSSLGRIGSVVVAAIDDDGNSGRILTYARERAAHLHTPLRAVHVWNGHWARTGRIVDSDRLLTEALFEHLPPDEAEIVERQILHDHDAAQALTALSREAALMVVAAGSSPGALEGILGDTTRRLVGQTWCPMAIVSPAPRRSSWW